MIKVYIASPYRIGDKEDNVAISIRVASHLIDAGFNPYVPLFNHFIDIRYSKKVEVWMALDLEWVAKCDCVFRLPGASRGADLEVEIATKINLPVFYTVEQLCAYYKERKDKKW